MEAHHGAVEACNGAVEAPLGSVGQCYRLNEDPDPHANKGGSTSEWKVGSSSGLETHRSSEKSDPVPRILKSAQITIKKYKLQCYRYEVIP
jgi:hypothetical protein